MTASLDEGTIVKTYNDLSFRQAFDSWSGTANISMRGFEEEKLTGKAYAELMLRKSAECKFSKEHYNWIWKPFIVYQELLAAKDGDFVVYHDASKYHRDGFSMRLRVLTDKLLRLGPRAANGVAGTCLPITVRRQFQRFAYHSTCASVGFAETLVASGVCRQGEVETACAKRFEWAAMYQASWVVLRKSDATMRLVERWATHAFSARTITSIPFQDQDALALAALELDFPCAFMPPGVDGVPNYKDGNDVKHINPFFTRDFLTLRPSDWTEQVWKKTLENPKMSPPVPP